MLCLGTGWGLQGWEQGVSSAVCGSCALSQLFLHTPLLDLKFRGRPLGEP